MEALEIIEKISGNKKVYEEILEKINSGNMIAFLGAGISAQRFPTWKGLIETLGEEAIELGHASKTNLRQWMDNAFSKPDLVSKRIKVKIGSQFINKLRSTFDNTKFEHKFDSIHDIIARLNFSSIITTNYDICMEEALVYYDKVRRENIFIGDDSKLGLFFQNLTENTFSLHYIHGTQYLPESFVFTSDDYDRLYNNTNFQNDLRSIVHHNSILFVGFGFQDFIIDKLIQDKSYFNPSNYAILGYKVTETDFEKGSINQDLSEIRHIWLDQYNSSILFYPVIEREVGNDYSNLEKVLELFDLNPDLPERPVVNSALKLPPVINDESIDFIIELIKSEINYQILNEDIIEIEGIGEIQIVKKSNYIEILNSFDEKRFYFMKSEFDSSVSSTKKLPKKYKTISLKDIFKVVMDFENYLEWFANDWEFDSISENYVSLEMTPDRRNNYLPSDPLIADEFLYDKVIENGPVINLLFGQFGMGKTIITKKIMYELSKQYLDGKIDKIPIYINLNDLSKEPHFPSLLSFQLRETFKIKGFDWERFQVLRDNGAFIFICDGLDEMDMRLDETVIIQTLNNLYSLIDLSPAILTSRPGLFHTKQEEDLLISELKTNPNNWYWVSPMGSDLIEHFSKNCFADKQDLTDFLNIIDENTKLTELSDRPLFLEMLIQSYKNSNLTQISSVKELYSSYVEKWIKRETEKGRTIINKEQKYNIFKDMAWQWLETSEINWKDVRDITEIQFDTEERRKILGVYFAEIMVSSFIGRNNEGLFFQHKSFAEYFVAMSIEENPGHSIFTSYELKIPKMSRNGIIEFIDDEPMLFQLYEYEADIENKISIIKSLEDLELVFRIGLRETNNRVGFHILSKLQNFPSDLFKQIIDEKLTSYPENSVEYIFKNQLLDLSDENAKIIIESKILDRELKINAVDLIKDQDYLIHLSLDHNDYQVRGAAVKKLPLEIVNTFFNQESIPDDIFLYCIFHSTDLTQVLYLSIHHRSQEIRLHCVKRLCELKLIMPQEFLLQIDFDKLEKIYLSNSDHKHLNDVFNLFTEENLVEIAEKYSRKERFGKKIIQRLQNIELLEKVSNINSKYLKPVRNRVKWLQENN